MMKMYVENYSELLGLRNKAYVLAKMMSILTTQLKKNQQMNGYVPS